MRNQVLNANGQPDGTWTFITNHAAVLLMIEDNRDVRLSQLADGVEITERAARRIVRDLVSGGYVAVLKHGRCNRYRINTDAKMRHPTVCTVLLSRLLELATELSPGEARELRDARLALA
jgi:predicted ArsR family transcriptional regulator